MQTYTILDNGGTSFSVTVHKNHICIYDKSMTTKLYTCNNAINVFVGHDPRDVSRLGNSLLIQTTNTKQRDDTIVVCQYMSPELVNLVTSYAQRKNSSLVYHYIHVGTSVFRFSTKYKIESYLSPVGNSSVPYPFALDETGTIYLIHDIYAAFNMHEVNTAIKVLCGNDVSSNILFDKSKILSGQTDPYSIYYETSNMSGCMAYVPPQPNFRQKYALDKKKMLSEINIAYLYPTPKYERGFTFRCPYNTLCRDYVSRYDFKKDNASKVEWDRLFTFEDYDEGLNYWVRISAPQHEKLMCIVFIDGTSIQLSREKWVDLSTQYMNDLCIGTPAKRGEIGEVHEILARPVDPV